jgi:transcription factor E
VNEFTIAKKLGITINQTRNLLYKISDYGLLISERKKDKKKGWYTYYWKFEIIKCLEFLKKKLLESRERFQTQIDRREQKQYYICEYCNLEYSEDEAILMDFTCDECGELFTTKDNSNLIKGLKKNLEKIDARLEEIEVEIVKEEKKLNRKKMASLKAEEEEKAKKKEEAKKRREEKRKEREKLKAEEKAKNGGVKKTAKKKAATKKATKKATKTKTEKKKATVKKVKAKKPSKKKSSSTKVIKKLVKKVSSPSKSAKKKVVKKKRK